jgi:hypothetical protein
MTDTLSYSFEELGLLIENGIEAGLVSGSAEISFHDNGEWAVRAIYLDGFKNGKPHQVEVDTRSEIYLNILDSLERGSRKDRIDAMVWSALEDRGVVSMSDYRQHNVHSFAFSGAK